MALGYSGECVCVYVREKREEGRKAKKVRVWDVCE